jgi:hypothetical protein
LRAEIKSLQADNLKLYEKVRYMQSYRDGGSSSIPISGPSGSSGGSLLNGVMRSREDDIGKYKDKYEESMNPFEAFKGRVSVVGMSYGDRTDVAGSAACDTSAEPHGAGRLRVD